MGDRRARSSRAAAWSSFAGDLRPELPRIAGALATSVLQSAAYLPLAGLVRSVFDSVIPARDVPLLVRICGALVVLYLAAGALALLTRRLAQESAKRSVARLRHRLVARVLVLPRRTFDGSDVARLHTLLVEDTRRIDALAGSLVADLVPSVVTAVLLGAVLAGLRADLFLAMAAVVALIWLVRLALRARVDRAVRDLHAVAERLSGSVLRLLRTLDLVRVRSAEPQERRRVGREIDEAGGVGARAVWLLHAYGYVQGTVATVSAAVVLALGGIAVVRGSMTLGQLAAFYVVMVLLQAQVRSFFTNLPQLLEGTESLRRVRGFLDEVPPAPYAGTRTIRLRGELTVADAALRFSRDEALAGVTLRFSPGEIVAVTGGNGAGKSTLLMLILGLYRPDGGALAADGVPYDELDLSHLRRQIGFVEQSPLVLPGTLAENVRFGRPEATDDDVRRSGRESGLDDLVGALPDGWGTTVGEDGATLSGGEKQRLAIARALVGDPRVLLLDEPTNNLDAAGRLHLLASLARLREGRTVVVVTHEPDFLHAADRVYVLAHGRVAGTGTPSQLAAVGLVPAAAGSAGS